MASRRAAASGLAQALTPMYGPLSLTDRGHSRARHKTSLCQIKFPTRHVIPELHMGLPMVHRVRDHDLRVWLISLLSRIGLGVFRTESVPISVPLDEFAVAHADYCRTFTTYRTWAELVKVFHGSGFRISYRYTSMLLQDALLGRSRRLHPALEAALFPVTRALSSVTLVTSTAQEYRFDWKDIT